MTVAAVVPAAGRGVRLGAELPKALQPVGGVPLVVRAVSTLQRVCDRVVVAAPEDLVDRFAGLLPTVSLVAGASTRQGSVSRALDRLARDGSGSDVVLVHDAARALTPVTLVRAVVDAVLAGSPAVVPGLPVPDTIKQVVTGTDGSLAVRHTVDRRDLRAVQTPQGFRLDVLLRAYAAAAASGLAGTDDAGLVEAAGVPVAVVEGDPLAFKVTTRLDLLLAEALLAGGVVLARGAPGAVPTVGPAVGPAAGPVVDQPSADARRGPG